jgi:hypothetical protein
MQSFLILFAIHIAPFAYIIPLNNSHCLLFLSVYFLFLNISRSFTFYAHIFPQMTAADIPIPLCFLMYRYTLVADYVSALFRYIPGTE